jgi:hypothetical protein
MYGENIMALLLQRTSCRLIEPRAIAAVYELFGDNMEIPSNRATPEPRGSFVWIQNGQDLAKMLEYTRGSGEC